jgi:hypothetical protein
MEWGSRSSDLIVSLGGKLNDPLFIKHWRDLRENTRALLDAWRRFMDTDAGEVEKVFDRTPAEVWTDDAIVEWRRQQRRAGDLWWYGYLIGSRRGATPEVVPYPTGADSDEDREAFRCGFTIAVEFTTDHEYSEAFAQELAELGSKYGRHCST